MEIGDSTSGRRVSGGEKEGLFLDDPTSGRRKKMVGRVEDRSVGTAPKRTRKNYLINYLEKQRKIGLCMPGNNRMLKWFEYSHLPDGAMQEISQQCAALAKYMDKGLVESAEKTAGLRKLLEAKDCFVRAKKEEMDAAKGLGAVEIGY